MRHNTHVHNLQDIFEDLNRRYFRGRVNAEVRWGRRGKGRKIVIEKRARQGVGALRADVQATPTFRRVRKSIRLGSYCVEDRLIRVHPVLDHPRVPRFFIEYVVYHEMLHQACGIPIIMTGSKYQHQFHSAQFCQAERRFPKYVDAVAWERKNIDWLLES